ncbi:helix-turn-helix transcriptional regulator [Yoonia sp.]|uniref:helix-turn-helix transcriptional regulator n=1 Tax=Yoonia sp. TaxID=2212373 RepID=UPI00358E0F35
MKYLSMNDLAEKMSCSRQTIHRMRDRGDLPPPVMLGRTPRWTEAEIDEALEKLRKDAA